MAVIYAILIGIIHGIMEFLPVSSFGHIVNLRSFLGVSDEFNTLFSVFLHTGTILAIFFVMRKEIRSLRREWLKLFRDLFANLLIYLKNRQSERKMGYVKLVTSKSRKFSVMILLSTIPTFLIGYSARNLIRLWGESPVWPGIGFLITGIILLVADFSKAGGRKGIAGVALDQPVWIGILQGLSIFPGISRLALTLCGGLFFGYSKSFAIRYAYLLSVPAVLGAFFFELTEFTSPAMNAGITGCCIAGMIAAFFTGFFCIRFLMKLLKSLPLRVFSGYCFVVGILTLILNFN